VRHIREAQKLAERDADDARALLRYERAAREAGETGYRQERNARDRAEVEADASRKLYRDERAVREHGEDAAAERTRVLQTVAHDIRSPLTSMRMQLELLRSTPSSPPPEHALDILERSIHRLDTFASDLLTTVRSESGQLTLNRKAVSLDDVTTEALDAIRPSVEQARVPVLFEPSGARIQADPGRLLQVFVNLLSNAVKFTPPGECVRIQVARGDSEVTVAISDGCAGLTAEQMAQLFKPFTKVHPGQAGTGLGLYIAKGIVEAHGGRIWVQSEGPGKGCTFTFSLPLRAEPRGAQAARR
jgi:signal transduction histidine kinase